jgi:hypothetical protein
MGWDRFAASLLAVAVAASASDACAMTQPVSENIHCLVTGADKLPHETGGADAVCDVIRTAIGKEAPNAQVHIEVRVLTPSMLTTVLVVGGRALPAQKLAVMDRKLNPRSIEQFAQSIAAKVAQAAAS